MVEVIVFEVAVGKTDLRQLAGQPFERDRGGRDVSVRDLPDTEKEE